MRRAGPLFRARPGGRDRENSMARKIPRRSKHSAMRAKAASQAKEHPHAKKTAQEVAPPAISSPETRGNLFPIVGVGASAGGLEAFTAFLKHLPTDSGMALVLIQHLDPQQHSQLAELLSKATKMPVVEVSVDTPIEPDHVYIMAPAACLSMADGHLRVERRAGGTCPSIISCDHWPRIRAAKPSESFFRVLLQMERCV